MRSFLRFWVAIMNIATLVGGIYAAITLLLSIRNIVIDREPDFSSVIAISFVIIPYCIARALAALADILPIDAPPNENIAPCPACLSDVPLSASKCRYCQTTLIPTD